MKIKIKKLAPFIALCYLIVSGSSILCAAASIYFVNKHAKPHFTSETSAQGKKIPVWTINRHVNSISKIPVSSHEAEKNISLTPFKDHYIVIKELFRYTYHSELPSALKGRAPPLM